jgi:hypothetical protein
MTKYVAFLRGVNVGGRIIKMVELKQCLEAAGLKNVSTFLQSGNVVFDSDKNEQQLKGLIESTMSETFSYSAKVIVTSMDDLKKIVDNNCYGDAPEDYIFRKRAGERLRYRISGINRRRSSSRPGCGLLEGKKRPDAKKHPREAAKQG